MVLSNRSGEHMFKIAAIIFTLGTLGLSWYSVRQREGVRQYLKYSWRLSEAGDSESDTYYKESLLSKFEGEE